MKWSLAGILFLFVLPLHAQNIPVEHEKFIYFPYPAQRNWNVSIGITGTTMPYEITEELHYRIPAADLHVIKKIAHNWVLDGRLDAQAIQNAITLGPHFVLPISPRTSIGLGNDVGFWFGFVNVQGFKTKGSGWQNFPNASLGYRFNKRILLTFKAESMMTLGITTYAGPNEVKTQYKLLSGSSYTVVLEQPFFGNKSLTLGLRAMYTTFFWQTWTAFTTFTRDFFYPQLIIGLVL